MKKPVSVLLAAFALCSLGSGTAAHAWQSDNGDGTYTNPPLHADYPDPDIIRVGADFYFLSSTFANSPGLRLLHSRDLVNWEIVCNIVERLEGKPEYAMQGGVAYRHGIFAPSLRHHGGVFYAAVTPVGLPTRIYRATDPAGPWTLNELNASAFDPALFIEPDGRGYIATSGAWDGTLFLLTLNEDYTRVVGEEKIHYNQGAEGSKLIRRGDWYYVFNAVPSRLGMTVSRARNLRGPWETRNQIDSSTGGHQGAIVDLDDNDNWFGFVHRDTNPVGRVTNISPIHWENDWPVWGTPDAPMRVPATARKPVQGHPVRQPATTDEFDSPVPGLQWAWNHSPDDSRWSLTERPGHLRLRPTRSDNFWTARNTLTQKGQGPWSRGEVKLDLRRLKPGDVAGFGTLGKFNGHIAVSRDAGGRLFLAMRLLEDTTEGIKTETRVASVPIRARYVHLRTDLDLVAGRALCSYSLDGKAWQPLGGEFEVAYSWQTGTFQGPQFAIFCYNPEPSDGHVDVDYFRFTDKK